MNAERQAIAGGVDGVADLRQPVRRIAHDMQDRPEHFALQPANRIDGEHMRREEHAIFQGRIDRKLAQQLGFERHAVGVLLQAVARLFVDHRPDIGGQLERIAERKFVHRAKNHLLHLVGGIFLQKENAQRAATLAGAVERRCIHIARDLLRQSRGIDNHRIHATGFCDDGWQRTLARGECAVEHDCCLGRSRKGNSR